MLSLFFFLSVSLTSLSIKNSAHEISITSVAVLLNYFFFLFPVEDTERNDGSNDRPYYMNKELMKILGKKNNKLLDGNNTD